MHHIMIMPNLSHLVIIVASDVCLVLRFFTDRTVELMRATTSSPTVFLDRCFPGEHSPLCYLFFSFASIYIAILCYDALVVAILLLFTLQPIYCLPSTTYCHVLSVSCLSLASRSACLGLLFDDDGKLSCDTLYVKLLSGNHYKVAPVGNS